MRSAARASRSSSSFSSLAVSCRLGLGLGEEGRVVLRVEHLDAGLGGGGVELLDGGEVLLRLRHRLEDLVVGDEAVGRGRGSGSRSKARFPVPALPFAAEAAAFAFGAGDVGAAAFAAETACAGVLAGWRPP